MTRNTENRHAGDVPATADGTFDSCKAEDLLLARHGKDAMSSKFTELIAIIRSRPGMYIGKNNIFCLKAFIDGWYFRDESKDTEIELLNEFYFWLQEKYNIHDNRNWDELLFLIFKDEKKALDHFFRLFDDFLSEK
jgi:hypothetical protein